MPVTDSGFGSNNPFRRNTAKDPSSTAITLSGPTPASTTTTTAVHSLNSNSKSSAISFDGPADSPLDSTDASRPPPPPLTTFKSAGPDGDKSRSDSSTDEPPVQTRPRKVVKKVRVQSPPPSSPEDSAPARRLALDESSDDSSVDEREPVEQIDPFSSRSIEPERNNGAFDASNSESPLPLPPANPFSKTLQDMEQSALEREDQTAAGGKTALDVDSFKRLLLTGYANIPGPGSSTATTSNPGPTSQQTTIPDGASNTDASSVSKQSIFDLVQETPRTSHEISEAEETTIAPSSPLANVQSTSGRKPPPPPSSRHGKLIKMELGADSKVKKGPPPAISVDTAYPTTVPNRKNSAQSLSQSSPPSSSDINKPLPPPPLRASGEEDVDSPFDREAAGKLPEAFADHTTSPQPPTPAARTTRPRSESQTSTLTTSSSHRKPAAPPPRRHGHARADSRPPSILSDKPEEDRPRSSLDSTRSRASSLQVNTGPEKNHAVPAPPPPRRPNHARQSSVLMSPSATSSTQALSPGTSEESRSPGALGFNPIEHQNLGPMAAATHSRDGLPKQSPPPPPPKRHSSVRRPSSNSVETTSSRKVSREKEGNAVKPPPPPPRARGSSKPTLGPADVHGSAGRPRSESEGGNVDEEHVVAELELTRVDSGAGDDIMEQLRALQQEVEAARKVSSSG